MKLNHGGIILQMVLKEKPNLIPMTVLWILNCILASANIIEI